MNMMPKMMKPFMTQFSSNFKSALFCLHSPRTSLVYRYHVISRTQSHSAVFGCSSSRWMPGAIPTARRHVVDSWATSLLVGLNMYRAGGTDWGKNKVYFGNIVPKQWTLSGFVQHTSANSMYKDDNKIIQQQKVLHMNKMLERDTCSNEF